MGEETIKQIIVRVTKELTYKLVLPIYLWSVGFKTLDDYIARIEEQAE